MRSFPGISFVLSRWSAGFLSSARCASRAAICRRYFASLALVDIPGFPWSLLAVVAERHAETPEEFACLVVVAGTGDEGDVHPLGEGHLVRVDLGEHQLFGEPH